MRHLVFSRFLGAIVLCQALAGCETTPPPSPPPAPSVAASPPPTAIDAAPPVEDAVPPEDAGPPAPPPIVAVALAKGENASSALAVDVHNLYWIDEQAGIVTRVSKRGGTQALVNSGSGSGFNGPASLALDEKNIYWTQRTGPADPATAGASTSAVLRQDKDGGAPVTIMQSATDEFRSVVIDGANLYWVSGRAVFRASKTGGPAVTLAGAARRDATSVASDGTNAFFTLHGSADKSFADGAVMRVPVKGGAPVVFAAAQAQADDVQVDDKNVYWTSAERIMKAPKAGGAPAVLATGPAPIADLTSDGTYVYYATGGADGTVARVAAAGGEPEVLATGQPNPAGIATDVAAVFWTCRGTEAKHFHDGMVMRRDKPAAASP